MTASTSRRTANRAFVLRTVAAWILYAVGLGIAEAVMVAFVVSTGLILAVGVLQFFLIPDLNWIFAFSILMVSWAAGTVVSAVRYR